VSFAAVSSTLQRMASHRPHIDLPVGVVSSLSRPRRRGRPVLAYSPVNRQERSPPRDPHTPRRPINMDESPEAGKVRGFVTPARRTSSGGMGQKLLGGVSRSSSSNRRPSTSHSEISFPYTRMIFESGETRGALETSLLSLVGIFRQRKTYIYQLSRNQFTKRRCLTDCSKTPRKRYKRIHLIQAHLCVSKIFRGGSMLK